VRLAEAIISVVAAFLLFLVVHNIYPKIVLVNISEELAKSEEINIKKYNLIYLGCTAIIVALGVKMVGGLLTAALVAISASAARNLGRNLAQYAFGAMIIGIISSFLGVLFFRLSGFPAGPLIIVASTLIFLISLIFRR